MIDTHGNVRKGYARKGHEEREYLKVKNEICELLDAEVPDREIAARMNLSPDTFYRLKKRIFEEAITRDIKINVATRQYMRIEHQLSQLIKYMDALWISGIPPDATYLTAFTNLNRRLADLVGANAAIDININGPEDDEERQETRDHEFRMAQQLNRFYELQDRLSGGDRGIGSGMTKEERDRELANLRAAVGELGIGVEDAITPEDEWDRTDEAEEDDIEDAIEVVTIDGFDAHDWDVGDEVIEIPKVTNRDRQIAIRECASGSGDQETPGRWVKGKFVSWWHDMGDDMVEAEWDMDEAPPAEDALS